MYRKFEPCLFKELSLNSIPICKWGHVFGAKYMLHPSAISFSNSGCRRFVLRKLYVMVGKISQPVLKLVS